MWFIILLILIILIILSCREGFGIFDKLYNSPTVRYNHTLDLPYCSDCLGKPVPCLKPCGQSYVLSNGLNAGAECKTCDYEYPVPVMGVKQGAYSPSVWTPGTPFS